MASMYASATEGKKRKGSDREVEADGQRGSGKEHGDGRRLVGAVDTYGVGGMGGFEHRQGDAAKPLVWPSCARRTLRDLGLCVGVHLHDHTHAALRAVARALITTPRRPVFDQRRA